MYGTQDYSPAQLGVCNQGFIATCPGVQTTSTSTSTSDDTSTATSDTSSTSTSTTDADTPTPTTEDATLTTGSTSISHGSHISAIQSVVVLVVIFGLLLFTVV
eukprot:TRINITY_DN1019_c0_g1_i1.p1 TRINITY_DN1019_c0_g1~~TRINITY_DN1019_c0_g1_i1.p1  ORF type:complete len:103 (-),score=11.81 TRINITY_DN1019_c0_g1_i1:169-477(-)